MTPARSSNSFTRELERLKADGRALLARIRRLKPILLWTYRAGNTISVGAGAGLRFSAGPSNRRYEIGDNELPVQEALQARLAPGAVFYDVGANVGFMTVIAARLVEGSGRVYAFEPVIENAVLLRQNVRRNRFRNVRVCATAVSKVSGSDRLMLAEYSGGSALSIAELPPDAIGERPVQTASIDDLIASGFVPPSLVKIDVEGAELEVLEGMSETLKRHRPDVLFEIDGEERSVVETKSRRCIAFLEAHDYAVSRLRDSYSDTAWIVEHYLGTPAQ